VAVPRRRTTASGDERIIECLEHVVRLLALQVAGDRSITEGVRLLKLAGLDNRTIAEALGTTDATVRTLGTGIRPGGRPVGRRR
jgi:hypothetical protein